MLEMLFEFPEGLPRRPKSGDMLKEGLFEYEVTSSRAWNNQYQVFAKPVGIAKAWYWLIALWLLMTNQLGDRLK